MTLDACNQTRPCVDSAWAWTGAERCNGAYVEREYKSNCDNIDWRIERAVTWVDTGNYRCGATTTEVEQRNDCGSTRWISGVPFVWTATGETRCKNHVIENKEINDCGDTRWTTTTEVCGYSPSVPFVIEVFDGCCGGNQVGYMYHPDEDRDPSATVAVKDCDGVVWGYIYPTVATGRTLPVGGCGETPIGYAVNQSKTAPSFAQCGGDIGGSFTLPTDLDAQTLRLTGNQLSISNGNTVSIPVPSVGTAPAVVSDADIPTDVVGTDDYLLGKPTAYLSFVVAGTTYNIPAYALER